MTHSSDPSTTRRLADFGRRSRWLAAELLVIVVGVLVALAIDEWRENVEDARTAAEYLHQLVADLESTERQMIDAGEVNGVSESATRKLVAAFEGRESTLLSDVRQLLTEVEVFDNPVPVLGAAEALMSTGDLRLIGDATTRLEITSYLSRSRDYFLVPLYQHEEVHRDLILQLYKLAQQYGISPQDSGGHAHGGKESDVSSFLASSEAYAVTLRLAKIKSDMAWYRQSVGADSSKMRQSLELLIAMQ